jgi:hypothetical protein
MPLMKRITNSFERWPPEARVNVDESEYKHNGTNWCHHFSEQKKRPCAQSHKAACE